MADRHFSRRPRVRPAQRAVEPRSGSQPPRSSRRSGPASSTLKGRDALIGELTEMAWRLAVAYCTCVTVQAALEGQGAERDGEFARCLRGGVSDAVSRQVERLHGLVGRLGGRRHPAATEL
jgi:hypothetical protein